MLKMLSVQFAACDCGRCAVRNLWRDCHANKLRAFRGSVPKRSPNSLSLDCSGNAPTSGPTARADARLSLRYEPLHPLVGDFARLVVHVSPAPEVDVLARDDVGANLVVDTFRLKHDDDPVLKRHQPLPSSTRSELSTPFRTCAVTSNDWPCETARRTQC